MRRPKQTATEVWTGEMKKQAGEAEVAKSVSEEVRVEEVQTCVRLARRTLRILRC